MKATYEAMNRAVTRKLIVAKFLDNRLSLADGKHELPSVAAVRRYAAECYHSFMSQLRKCKTERQHAELNRALNTQLRKARDVLHAH